MNSSTPHLAILYSEHSIVNNTPRHKAPLLLQPHVMMSQQPLPNAKAVQVTAQGPSGDSHERLNSRPMSDHEDDQGSNSACTGSVTAKTFPETLKEILSDPENQDAIAWLPHGKAFLVMDRTLFVQNVLPRYLGKATKYTSFTRKLTRWNFVRVASGPDEGAWFNKSFFKDYTCDKLKVMKCAKRKKSQPVKEFPRSKPLKKRPVDPSLFAKDPTTLDGKARRPLIQASRPAAYSYGGRPLALADTRSVVQAAMRALIQANPAAAPEVSALTHTSMYPTSFLNPTLNANVISAALQAARNGFDSR